MLFSIFEQIFIALASVQELNSGQNPVLKLQQKGFFCIILRHMNSQFLPSSELCLNLHHLLGRQGEDTALHRLCDRVTGGEKYYSWLKKYILLHTT